MAQIPKAHRLQPVEHRDGHRAKRLVGSFEPFLLQQGLVLRTPRGRMLGMKAWRHLGLEAPKAPGQSDLFEGQV